jgi:hypothetical protein
VTPTRTLACIRGELGREEAASIARRAWPEVARSRLRRLYYPYHWFLFRSVARSFLGAGSTRISCLVDARNGLFATSDPFEVVSCSVEEKDVLDCALAESDAEALARQKAPRVVRPRRRSLSAARLELCEHRLVHRPLWVVTTERAGLLVDGVTGALLPLSS